MTNTPWRILVIDDTPQMADDMAREISDAFSDESELTVSVQTSNDFDEGYAIVARGDCDIVVLDLRRETVGDVREDATAGSEVFSRIKDVRFLPVVFWTALPAQVAALEMEPLVFVFEKRDLTKVPGAIRAAIASRSVEVMRGIETHVATTMRDHMWRQLAPNWYEDTSGGHPDDLARILITRVAQSLQEQDLPALTSNPSHCYLYPPVAKMFRPGDVLHRGENNVTRWWSILTPACDLAHENKADFVLLAKANEVEHLSLYKTWLKSDSNKTWSALMDVLAGKRARYHFLPAYRDIPNLLVDLEDVVSVPKSELAQFTRAASLVSPFSEALLTKYSHFRGRIGTPDLDSAVVKASFVRLGAAVASGETPAEGVA